MGLLSYRKKNQMDSLKQFQSKEEYNTYYLRHRIFFLKFI